MYLYWYVYRYLDDFGWNMLENHETFFFWTPNDGDMSQKNGGNMGKTIILVTGNVIIFFTTDEKQ